MAEGFAMLDVAPNGSEVVALLVMLLLHHAAVVLICAWCVLPGALRRIAQPSAEAMRICQAECTSVRLALQGLQRDCSRRPSVFIDPNSGDDANAGGRTDPVQSLSRALSLLHGGGGGLRAQAKNVKSKHLQRELPQMKAAAGEPTALSPSPCDPIPSSPRLSRSETRQNSRVKSAVATCGVKSARDTKTVPLPCGSCAAANEPSAERVKANSISKLGTLELRGRTRYVRLDGCDLAIYRGGAASVADDDLNSFHVQTLNVAGAEIEREDEFLELVLADGSDVQLRAATIAECRQWYTKLSECARIT